MQKIFIVHGFGGKPNGRWRSWLMGELAERGQYACALPMPEPDAPQLAAWVAEIARIVDREQGHALYFVAHSLGVAALLRFLEGRGSASGIAGAVLVSGPSESTGNTMTSAFFRTPFDYAAIRPLIGRCVVIHGSEDDLVPLAHARVHADGLGAELRVVEGAGHFNSGGGCTTIPEVLESLLGMLDATEIDPSQ